jgi:hypothetical protein
MDVIRHLKRQTHVGTYSECTRNGEAKLKPFYFLSDRLLSNVIVLFSPDDGCSWPLSCSVGVIVALFYDSEKLSSFAIKQIRQADFCGLECNVSGSVLGF